MHLYYDRLVMIYTVTKRTVYMLWIFPDLNSFNSNSSNGETKNSRTKSFEIQNFKR